MAKIHHPWDTLMKELMGKGAQALASLALPGVQIGDALNRELSIKKIKGDYFCNAYLDNFAIIVHFEFQKKKHGVMDRRMWEYNCAMDISTGKPVYSILVYLVKEENLVGSPYVGAIPRTGTGHHFIFHVIKLWEIAPEVLKQSGFEELLPLLPLTKGGRTLATVDDMITELVARNRSDLLDLGKLCAGLVFKDEFDKQWLEERFKNVQEIIESSWVYQQTLEKGGQQALRATANRIAAARFPELEQLAKEIVEMIKDLDQLQMLAVELSIASSQEHAKQLLLSHVSGA
jgi:hypothetical protein